MSLEKGDLVRVDMPHNAMYDGRLAVVEGLSETRFDVKGENCYFVLFVDDGRRSLFVEEELVKVA